MAVKYKPVDANQWNNSERSDISCSQSDADRSTDKFEVTNAFVVQEIRTSLTPIQGVLSLLKAGQLASLSETGQHLISTALNNTKRLIRLTEIVENEFIPPVEILSSTDVERLQLITDLHQAWKNDEFRVFYQPIVSADDLRITGFEALLRWIHPTRGSISPAVFIPLAEEIGLIYCLGLWVLEEACAQLKEWQQSFPQLCLSISVNLSPLQLSQLELVSEIQKILQKNDISPQDLKLEITEGSLIENSQTAIALLLELRSIGIQLSIDDFGTGYSSLSRIQDLPINILKIDRIFIKNKQWSLIHNILSIASSLGLEVVAEGVETYEELDQMQSMGCKQVQGYFFSVPLDGPSITHLISKPFDLPQLLRQTPAHNHIDGLRG